MSVHSSNVDSTLKDFLTISARRIQRRDDWFTRFTIDDFMPSDVDHNLRSSFPNWIIEDLPADVLNVSVGLDDTKIKKFLTENAEWRGYVEYLTSSFFLDELISVFEPEIRRRYQKVWRPFLSRRPLRRENLFLTVLFSASRRGFRLTPHSDDKFKVVSLIHYFPEFANKGHAAAGTRFFTPRNQQLSVTALRSHSNWSRGIRKFLPFRLAPSFEYSLSRRRTESESVDSTQLAEFLETFKSSEILEYSPNRLTGFIKNAWSVHEVDLSDFPADELRRAIIVNVRLVPPYSVEFLDQVDKILSSTKGAIKKILGK